MKNCKCNFTEKVQESSVAVWLFAICGFLLGIIFGFLFSPVKKGVTIGSNNVSNVYKTEELDGYGFDDEDYDEE